MDAPALRRLFGTPGELGRAWGRSAVHVPRARRGTDDFADLFSLDAVDELLSHRGLRAPFLRMAKDGRTLPESQFTLGGGVGAGIGDQVSDDRVRGLFAGGATIVLQALHRTWQPLTAFSQQLAAELGHPVQINAYITPSQNRGFADHYDIHDVFVLQVHGAKRWIVHEPVFEHPLRSQPWEQRADDVRAAAQTPPSIDVTLEPGDVLYLPRGFIHAAEALGETSAHLTIGIHTWTGDHIAGVLMDAARAALTDDPAVRASLPLGTDVSDAAALSGDVDRVREALIAALRKATPEDVAQALHAQHRGSQRPASLPPIAQLAAADGLTGGSVLVVREHLAATVETPGEGRFIVRSRAGRFPLNADVRPAVERLLAGEPVPVSDLSADPDLALTAARTLVAEGVAVVRR